METYTFTILSADTENNSVLVKYTPDNVVLSEVTQNIFSHSDDFLQSIQQNAPQDYWQKELGLKEKIVEIYNFIGKSETMTEDKLTEIASMYKSKNLDNQSMGNIEQQFLEELF